MFLTNDNKMMWRRLIWATLITGVIVFVGVCCLDVYIYMIATYISNWNLWHVIGKVFDAKNWLIVTFVVLGGYGVKRLVKTIQSIRNHEIRFNLVDVSRNFFLKTKTSNAFLMFSSVFCACLTAWGLKILIARLRPVFVMSGQIPEFNRFAWEWHSMPSGHTIVTFAGLVMIGMLAPKFKPLTWTIACVVGLSRICIGVHWFSDVILGAFFGMVIADFIKCLLLKKPKSALDNR